MTTYLDVEIRVVKRGETDYAVEIDLDGQQQFSGTLADGIAAWTPSGDVEADGRALFAALFADAVLRDAWAEARGRSPQRRVRLWLDANAPRLHALPWECLASDEGMLAAHANTPFSRYLASVRPWGAAITERPIRVLAAIANPSDLADYNLAPLDGTAERALLTDAFAALDPATLRLDILEPPVTLARIEAALRQGYHALHFVGHGIYNKHQQQAALYIEGEDGEARRLIDAELVDMLTRQGIQPRLIFLAACQSATRSTANAYLGLGPKLVAAGVPAVVAMQGPVSMPSARALSRAFYQNLAAADTRAQVDVALNAARGTLLTLSRADAAVPVLLMRLKSGLLWGSDLQHPPGMNVTATISDGDFVSGDKITYNYALDLPGLVEALRTALPAGDPQPRHLMAALEQFKTLHTALYEWKELHNYLNDIVFVMDQFAREVERLDAKGQPGDPRRLARQWRPVAGKVQMLLDWAGGDIRHIAAERFAETPQGWQGPRWAVEVAMTARHVEALLKPSEFDLLAIYDATYAFTDAASRQMYLADKGLRDTAGKLYAISQVVLGELSA